MPIQPEPSWRDGLRSLRPDEFAELEALLGKVFRPTLVEEYPHLYTPQNAADLRVVVKDGKVVSHIGTLRRHASILGCTVKVASLGGVATLPEYRGRGYATALFADTLRLCREDGVDFMLVSGYRKLYHRYGCRYVGRYLRFTLPRERARSFAERGLELRRVRREDLSALAALYRREPLRWLRPPSDFSNALVGHVMNHPARVLGAWDKDQLRAWAIVEEKRPPDPEGRTRVLDFAGERSSLAALLGRILEAGDLEALELHVAQSDALFCRLLFEGGLEARPAPASGTVVLVDFLQFMEKMRPHFVERLGRAAAALVFEERGDHLVFSWGGDQVVAADRGEAVQLIFGTVEGGEEKLLKEGGRAGEALREIFPLPALWYGVNYI